MDYPFAGLAVLSLCLAGCATHKHGSPGRIVLESDCIKSINVIPGKTYCDKPVDGKDGLSCHKATVTYVKDCEELEVKNKKGESPK